MGPAYPNPPVDLAMVPERLEGGLPVLRLRGALDRAAVYQLRDEVIRLGAPVVALDFSRLRDVSDFALAILAMWTAEPDAPELRLLGLPQHAEGVLRAFGIRPAAPDPEQAEGGTA